jgi:carbon-monoxide dehydrogenase small subunit
MNDLIPLQDRPLREKLRLSLTVNGEERQLLCDGYKTLLELLREDLALTGTKHGCELGECGACAVLLDGELVLSCLVAAPECDGRLVETVEGMQIGAELHPLQACFADHGAAQCGYCTPGFLLAAKELLERKPEATRAEIAEALSGQLCRCTGYLQIFEAVESAARILRGEAPLPPSLGTVLGPIGETAQSRGETAQSRSVTAESGGDER